MGVTFRDVGTEIQLDTGQDLTTATSLSVVVEKAGSQTVVYPAVVVDPATGGVLKVVKTANTFNSPGTYMVRAEVYFGSSLFYGEKAELVVEY